jgi:exopolysaccharide biosynthesis protein
MIAARTFNATLLALATSVAVAHADWTVASTNSDFSAGRVAEHRHVVVRSSAGDEATLEFGLFSPRTATLRVIDRPGANDELASVMERENCIAGVNGGYFDPEYAPVGLLISDGRVVAPQQKARLLSGVVSVVNGRVLLQRAAEFSARSKPIAARQCGPFLVDDGKPVPNLNDVRAARRTFVLIAGERAAIGFCSQVTLAQLGSILATPGVVGSGKVQRALNLDGGSSSGFWFAAEEGPFSISEQKTVRDYLAVVAK